MMSTKTNIGKLPLPERKFQGSVTAPTPHLNAAATVAGDIIGDLPEVLDRKKHPELNALARKPATVSGTINALVAQIQDPEKRAAVERVEAEKTAKRATKRAVKAQRSKAAANGATKAMPLTGKDAVKAIRAARKTHADDKSGGKAALRALAKKAVEETKVPVTKVPAGVKGKVVAKKPGTEVKAAKAPTRSVTSYDWDGAALKAKTGTVPPTPPFASYGPHMKKAHDMAKAGQAKELREYLKGFTSDPCPPSRKNLFRYGELCLTALKGAAAGPGKGA